MPTGYGAAGRGRTPLASVLGYPPDAGHRGLRHEVVGHDMVGSSVPQVGDPVTIASPGAVGRRAIDGGEIACVDEYGALHGKRVGVTGDHGNHPN
eukprot:6656253-Pyramimonas_sp.AAC.1